MNVQKRILIVVGVLILISCFGVVSALPPVLPEDSCEVKTKSQCTIDGGFGILELSSTTNAHVQSVVIGTYPYVLCCNFGGEGDRLCSSTNQFIKYSSATNAHAESPSHTSPFFENEACYSDLKCWGISGGCPTQYSSQMVSLSSEWNGHVGAFEKYDYKICCSHCGNGMTEPGEECDSEPFCAPDCTLLIRDKCGNGVIDPEPPYSENCDDGGLCAEGNNIRFG